VRWSRPDLNESWNGPERLDRRNSAAFKQPHPPSAEARQVARIMAAGMKQKARG